MKAIIKSVPVQVLAINTIALALLCAYSLV